MWVFLTRNKQQGGSAGRVPGDWGIPQRAGFEEMDVSACRLTVILFP